MVLADVKRPIRCLVGHGGIDRNDLRISSESRAQRSEGFRMGLECVDRRGGKELSVPGHRVAAMGSHIQDQGGRLVPQELEPVAEGIPRGDTRWPGARVLATA